MTPAGVQGANRMSPRHDAADILRVKGIDILFGVNGQNDFLFVYVLGHRPADTKYRDAVVVIELSMSASQLGLGGRRRPKRAFRCKSRSQHTPFPYCGRKSVTPGRRPLK